MAIENISEIIKSYEDKTKMLKIVDESGIDTSRMVFVKEIMSLYADFDYDEALAKEFMAKLNDVFNVLQDDIFENVRHDHKFIYHMIACEKDGMKFDIDVSWNVKIESNTSDISVIDNSALAKTMFESFKPIAAKYGVAGKQAINMFMEVSKSFNLKF